MSNTQLTGRRTLAERVCLASTQQLTRETGTAKSPRAGTCSGVWKADQHRSRGTGYVINRIHTLLVTGSFLERMGCWNRKFVQNPQDSRGWKSLSLGTQSANKGRDKKSLISKHATAHSRNTECFPHSALPLGVPLARAVHASCKNFGMFGFPFPFPHTALSSPTTPDNISELPSDVFLPWCLWGLHCALLVSSAASSHLSILLLGTFFPFTSSSCWPALPYHW